MSRAKTIMLTLAAILVAVGTSTPSANAQLIGPETGWVPGQPIVVSITGPGGVPHMVVFVGRIPLATDARVRLMLPSLEDTGLSYAVTTSGRHAPRRPLHSEPSGAEKKPQEVVGRIHLVHETSPATVTLGTNNDPLSVADSVGEHTLGHVSTGGNNGMMNSTAGDGSGVGRRAEQPKVPKTRWFKTGEGVLVRKDGSLGIRRGSLSAFDPTVAGPLESGIGSGGGAGLVVGNSATRRSLGGHSLGNRALPPTRSKNGPRPFIDISFFTNAHLQRGGTLGNGTVVILIDDQGLDFEGASG